ncbi:MAG: DmsC/YnfH family molybdoenzyme membrane anchor subunit [Pseudomonadota bacterium]
MHPAISVIFFTVTSGAGFGFLALIGLGVPLPADGIGAFVAAVIAGGLCVAGLVSSTFHLGHPERAWRAFSQWRSSWLSREGVCAVFTLILFGLYALNWVFFGERNYLLGLLVTLGSLATVFTTAMIYAQLKTVPSWNTLLTPVCYMLFALGSGVLLAASFGFWQSSGGMTVKFIALFAIAIAWSAKFLWWQAATGNTLEGRGSTPETATGLGSIGKVRLLEKPHSGENYLTKEMVHQVGRKHAAKLRTLAVLFGAGVPILLCLLIFVSGMPSYVLALAFISWMLGLFAERWLFFAEAKHAVSLYY